MRILCALILYILPLISTESPQELTTYRRDRAPSAPAALTVPTSDTVALPHTDQEIHRIEHYRIYFVPRSKGRRDLHHSPVASPPALSSSPESSSPVVSSPVPPSPPATDIYRDYHIIRTAPRVLLDKTPTAEEHKPQRNSPPPQDLDIEVQASIEAQLSWWQRLKCFCSCSGSRR